MKLSLNLDTNGKSTTAFFEIMFLVSLLFPLTVTTSICARLELVTQEITKVSSVNLVASVFIVFF